MNLREITTSNLHNFVFTSSEDSIHMCGLNYKLVSPFKKLIKLFLNTYIRRNNSPIKRATTLYDLQKDNDSNYYIVRFADKRGRKLHDIRTGTSNDQKKWTLRRKNNGPIQNSNSHS